MSKQERHRKPAPSKRSEQNSEKERNTEVEEDEDDIIDLEDLEARVKSSMKVVNGYRQHTGQ